MRAVTQIEFIQITSILFKMVCSSFNTAYSEDLSHIFIHFTNLHIMVLKNFDLLALDVFAKRRGQGYMSVNVNYYCIVCQIGPLPSQPPAQFYTPSPQSAVYLFFKQMLHSIFWSLVLLFPDPVKRSIGVVRDNFSVTFVWYTKILQPSGILYFLFTVNIKPKKRIKIHLYTQCADRFDL